ncbi:MAG: hypothetical protein EKK33_11805, partial [Bradyrhizobiaceae bacterium]
MSETLPFFLSLFVDGLARRPASLHLHILPLQTAAMSPIPAVPSAFRPPAPLPLALASAPMSATPSKTMAALWMAGWLSLMLVMAIAG